MLASIAAVTRWVDDWAERILFERRYRTALFRGVFLLMLTSVLLLARRTPLPVDCKGLAGNTDLADKQWIDRMPTRRDDHFGYYYFGTDDLGRHWRSGVHISGTPEKYTVETFMYQVRDNCLRIFFNADKRDTSSTYSVKAERNGKFELKLTLDRDPKDGGKTHTYWGRNDGKLPSGYFTPSAAGLN